MPALLNDVHVAYQPVFNLHTGGVMAVEAKAKPSSGSVRALLRHAADTGQLTPTDYGLAALARQSWPADARLCQAWITTACMIRYVGLADPDLLPTGRYPALDAVSARCEALPSFKATYPADYVVPSTD